MAEVLIAPARSRVQGHFDRWRGRWSQMTADSFRRSSGTSLGTADTGVGWGEAGDFTPGAGQGFWKLLNGAAMAQDGVPGGNWIVASLLSAGTDAAIRVRCGFTTALPVFLAIQEGIFYRSADGRVGRYFVYCGGGFYRYGSIDLTTSPATVAVNGVVVGPTWSVGEQHLLGVDLVGDQNVLSVDGVVLDVPAIASPGPGYGRHGILACVGIDPVRFTRFRAVAAG